MTVSKTENHYVFAANLADIQSAGGCLPVQIEKHTIAIFYYASKVYAIDNRCPHMGFPLSRGTVKDGILTCHWHHARFDVMSGGTFDQWAGDVPSFPVQIRNGNEVWIGISNSSLDPITYYQTLLQNGLKQNIPLLIAKAVIAMSNQDNNKIEKENNNKKDDTNLRKAFYAGLEFGTHYKQSGWSQGLTIHTCMMNILPYLNTQEHREYAICHGLSAVAQDCASNPPRFEVSPLPPPWPNLALLKQWFCNFIELRDAQAAERCIVTAVRVGANDQQIADILFAAATDHRYLDLGHILDFTNKALESLDIVGWDNNKEIVESVLSSLVLGYANAERMEESNSWRHPIDLITILEDAFNKLPVVIESGSSKRNKQEQEKWNAREKLVHVLLGDDPHLIAQALLDSLDQGAGEVELASSVSYAAALRIAQFHTQNEFSDWDTALHTFTFANAVYQGIQRVSTPELLRGVFDAAMRIYLNRFLNIPPASLPKPKLTEKNNSDSSDSDTTSSYAKTLLKEFPSLLDKQQQVNQAGQLVADYLYNDGNPDQLLNRIGEILLREDRTFHSIQMIEAAFRQYSSLPGEHNFAARVNIVVAAARYLAAHSPTMRSQCRTYQIARKLFHGEHLFEE